MLWMSLGDANCESIEHLFHVSKFNWAMAIARRLDLTKECFLVISLGWNEENINNQWKNA